MQLSTATVMCRCHRDVMESSCTLELRRRPCTNVQVKVGACRIPLPSFAQAHYHFSGE